MEKKVKFVTPVYQQIAADIAAKIAGGHYHINEKIYARSSLASQYGVSAETARRAICVLSDMDIVDTEKGSGVTIKSRDNAIHFIKQFEDVKSVTDLKKEIFECVMRQRKENILLEERISDLLDKTERFKAINPFVPFEITITALASCLNKTVAEVRFWQNTGATVVAIKREEALMMSPGPCAAFQDGDIVYFIGDENCDQRVRSFLYPA